ncbi:Pogo transposable element with KRAB, partial [Stegodyphus mimosarum]
MIREWRKQEDQLQKLDKSKHTLRGPTARWPELEVEVKEWITRHRQNGLSVSTKMIIYEAKRIAVEKGIQDFTESPSWCYRFMKRSGLFMRTKTRIAQKMPKEYESKILSFHKFVIDARKKNNFEMSQIGNMDNLTCC